MMAAVETWTRSWSERTDANPKLGTVTFDVKTAVEDLKGKAQYKVDKAGVVPSIGRTSMSIEDLTPMLRL